MQLSPRQRQGPFHALQAAVRSICWGGPVLPRVTSLQQFDAEAPKEMEDVRARPTCVAIHDIPLNSRPAQLCVVLCVALLFALFVKVPCGIWIVL